MPRWINVFDGKASDPWLVAVQMHYEEDGTPLMVGLRLEPNPKFKGPVKDQNLTKRELAAFDRDYAIQLAASGSGRTVRLPKSSFDLKDSILAQFMSVDDLFDTTTRQGRIEAAAHLYREANKRGLPPRLHIAEAMDCNVQTVDRYLREARKQGLLPAYDGPQAVHGKKKKTSGTSRNSKKG